MAENNYGLGFELSELDQQVPGYLEQTRSNLGKGRFDIACQNESYEVVLKAIWGTVMTLNSQLKIYKCIEIVRYYWQ